MGRGNHRIAGAVVALALGVGVGRFVTYEPASASSPVSVASLQSEAAEAVRSAASTGDPSFYERAEVALDRADELVPDDPNTTLVRGALALALHRFDEALAFGTTAAAVNPSSAAAQGILVDANVELGKYDAASTSLQRMLDLRPDLAALSRASYVRELHGDRAGAVEAMAAAEEAGGSPFDVASVAALRGELAVAGGDLDGALAHYERALGLAPGLVLAEVGRARVLGATGQEGQAIEALQAVVDRVPVPAALVLLGELQSRTGDPSGAAGTFELVRATAALQQASGQVVDLEMAVFEADSGDPVRAVELAERAAAARPDNVYVSDALGWALFRSGDAAAAVPHIEAALRLGSNDPVSLWHAAQVFAAVGSDARAADTLAGVAPSALAARLGQPVAR